MQQVIPLLFAHERQALREALFRDGCRELQQAESDDLWRDWHKYNARLSGRILRLLDVLEKLE